MRYKSYEYQKDGTVDIRYFRNILYKVAYSFLSLFDGSLLQLYTYFNVGNKM